MRKTVIAAAVAAAVVFSVGATAVPANAAVRTPEKIINAIATTQGSDITVQLTGVSNKVRLSAVEAGGEALQAVSRDRCTYKKAAKTPLSCTAVFKITGAEAGLHTIVIAAGKRGITVQVQIAGAETTPTTPAASAFETEMLAAVNAVRAKVGVPALTLCANLSKAAQNYAQNLADLNYFSHTGKDGSSPADRAEAAGYGRYVGENIAAGQQSVAEVMEDWVNSPGHYANLINAGYDHVGFGHYVNPAADYSGQRWVQNFGADGKCG